MKNDAVRWGILSTGAMAKRFAQDLEFAQSAELAAVASRAQKTAEAFGDKYAVPRRYGDYAELAADPDVDVVYIATPNSLHKENTLMCLESGKAVLCEKPFATNAAEAREMVACAREKKLFLMEAMWTRYFPLTTKLRELLAENALGDLRAVTADFGFKASEDELAGTITDRALGGGSLLDVGVYPVSFASMVFGPPTNVATLAHMGETGVDEQAGVILGHADGRLALLHSSITSTTPQEATIIGAERRARIHAPFWRPEKMTLLEEDDAVQVIEAPFQGIGHHFEAVEVMD